MTALLSAVALGAVLLQASLPMHDVDKGSQSGIDDGRQVVVRTGSAWATLWRQHHPSRPVPTVDFETEAVIAVFLGGRPTAGYSVEIASVAESGDALVVRYHERRPAADGIVAQVLTAPFHMVRVPARPGPVTFERTD